VQPRVLRWIIIGLIVCYSSYTHSQSTSSTQFSNELRFARAIAKRWTGELTFTNAWMPSPPAAGLFSRYSQWAMGAWAHNYIAPKWRLSAGFFYYREIEQEEPEQLKSNEFRLSGQANYYIKKIGYTVTWRSRLEWRLIENSEADYNSVLRLREQLKLIVAINGKSIRQGIFYGFGSEELLFKTPSDDNGNEFFDRNRFEIGAGYAVTNDMSIELYYTNEFVPRETNQINHIINVDLNFKNLITNIRKRLSPPQNSLPED
jgi:hypothetical protein